MELRHLRYFVAVAEELHFQRAAKRLHIEQSPLSRAIKDLENQLGVKLLERTTRCTAMTKAGQVFLHEARRILASVDHAKSAIQSSAMGYSRQLQIAITPGIPLQRLSRLIAKQRQHDEDIDIKLFEMDTVRIQQAVINQEIDVGLALLTPDDPRIEASSLWHDYLLAMLPAQHRLATSEVITMADLIPYPLVLPAARGANSVHCHLQRLLKHTHGTANVLQLTDSFSLTQTLVAAGLGIGFATTAQVRGHERDDVLVKRLDGQVPTMITYMLHHAHALPEVVLPFLKLLEEDDSTYEESVRQQRISF